MSAEQACAYHEAQVATLAQTDADMVAAFTMTYPEEAIGIALAAGSHAMPVAISFAVETDGRLPSGETLGEAIAATDRATGAYPAYYMINCAHPSHFAASVASDAPRSWRIRGLRANASTKSHAELDECTELDAGDPAALAGLYADARRRLPALSIVGGCCGTDDRQWTRCAARCSRGPMERRPYDARCLPPLAVSPPASRLAQFLRRVRAFVARPFRRAPAPGRFEFGSASSWRGYVATAPLVEPSRDYLVYLPGGWSRMRRAPLRVLCHGCRQSAEDLAALTRIAAHADREGCVVLLPQQAIDANAWGCWNWFETNTERGAGEAAIVAAQIVQVRRRYRLRRERVWVAGLSAGGALAAVLGLRHPRLARGIFVHSGVACGAASSAAGALAAMRQGPQNDVVRVADEARRALRGADPPDVPLLVVHGDRDDVVSSVNAAALVRQYLRFNGDESVSSDAPLRPSDASSHEEAGVRHGVRTDDWWIGGRVRVRETSVEGLAHAWSGGDGRFDYADPRGPDALLLFERFVADVDTRPTNFVARLRRRMQAAALTAAPK